METFKHKFFGWLEADARKWVNADGSEGGIVAIDASVHVSVRVSLGAEIGPRASIGYGASIGDGASIGYGEWFFTAGPQGGRNALLTAVLKPEGLRWWVGCRHNVTTEELLAAVEAFHGASAHGDDYRHIIKSIETHPGLARALEAQSKKQAA